MRTAALEGEPERVLATLAGEQPQSLLVMGSAAAPARFAATRIDGLQGALPGAERVLVVPTRVR